MTDQHVKGAVNTVKGTVNEGVGKLTGDKSQETKGKVMSRLARVLPGTKIQDQLTVVAGSNVAVPDVSPQIETLNSKLSTLETGVEALVARRSSNRAELRLSQASADLIRAAADDPKLADSLKKTAANVQSLLTDIRTERQSLETGGDIPRAQHASIYQGLAGKITEQSDALTRLVTGAPAAVKTAAPISTDPLTLDAATDLLASEAEHIASIASTLALAKSLRPDAGPAPVAQQVQLTPRERLDQFVRTKAIFFANGTDYRDAQFSAQVMQELAGLIKAAGVLVRVVGYTDEVGNLRRNLPLAQTRAEKVRQDLMTFGAPASLLSPIGRADVLDLSSSTGAASPNRRVQFEIAFDGEAFP
jgi:outer membrane protein OmpA-like peptidoglycan-associated protein/outer membrane murein-binding lipoprotein Lpp